MKELVFNLNDNDSQLQMIIIRIKKTPQLRGEKLHLGYIKADHIKPYVFITELIYI
tara:strand:- start:291 stop:458 length:168 start_codon:yes stop_codon:yes gene_type:complete